MSIRNLLITVCLSITVHNAYAIVSMESVHLGHPREGYSGAFDVNASGAWGNTQTGAVAAGLKLVRQKNPATDFVLVNYQYGESGGLRDKNKAFVHGRHIQQITPKHIDFYVCKNYNHHNESVILMIFLTIMSHKLIN